MLSNSHLEYTYRYIKGYFILATHRYEWMDKEIEYNWELFRQQREIY